MRVLIGALGLGKYDGTVYAFEDGSYEEADYFIYGLTRHVRPDHLFVIVTESAKNTALPELEEWIALEGVPITTVEIPTGQDRNEAWTIFNAVIARFTEKFSTGEVVPDVYIDITNGLRSIPVLMLSIVRYLQRSRQLNLQGIFYGAYDAVGRDAIEKPVYQLDSFITVLDWANAVDTFLTTGSSYLLAEMLETHTLEISESEKIEIADILRELSTALDLARIEDIHKQAHRLTSEISSIDFSKLRDENRIIVELLQKLRIEFEPLGMADPQTNIKEFLRKDLRLVFWYFKRNRYQDAMLIAREWMMTYKMQHKNVKNKRKYTSSELFEREIRNGEEGHHQWVSREKRELHRKINELRNSLAHGGLSGSDDSSQNVLNRVKIVMAELQQLEVLL